VIVLDASAAVELVLNTDAGRRVAKEIAPPEISLHVPHLLDVEVTHVLRAHVQRGAVPADQATQALVDYSELDLERYGHEDLLPRVWALRENLTAYDAVYVVLAQLLDATLLTCDAKLASATGHRARIHLLD
jgi:predicted nucleic acid-binding protein